MHDGDTETFTATLTLNPNGLPADLNNFQVGLNMVKFSTTDGLTGIQQLQTIDVDQTNSDFHTDPLTIAG